MGTCKRTIHGFGRYLSKKFGHNGHETFNPWSNSYSVHRLSCLNFGQWQLFQERPENCVRAHPTNMGMIERVALPNQLPQIINLKHYQVLLTFSRVKLWGTSKATETTNTNCKNLLPTWGHVLAQMKHIWSQVMCELTTQSGAVWGDFPWLCLHSSWDQF